MGRLILSALLLCLSMLTPAHAGRACDPKPADAAGVVKAMDLALQTRRALDASGAEVALIARVGQDLSQYHVRYSHMALAWRDHPAGRWLVVHELNQCGSAASALYNEGLGNFFLDDLFAYQTLMVLPNAATQARLARLLASRTPQRLHEAQYNMLSYVFSTRYQNSNQWVLETYAAASAAEGAVETRSEAQDWLQRERFEPITLDIPAPVRLGARLFRANVAFDDHPFARRMAGQIDTVTVDAVTRFIRRRDPEVREIVLSAD
jgi:hypothetical protein